MTSIAARAAAAVIALALGAGAGAAQIRIGSFAGVTGPVAEAAVEVTQARAMAAAQVNAAGGLFRSGEQMELILADTGCDAGAARDAARALIDRAGIVAAVAPMCSAAAAAAAAITIPAGLLMIADTATAQSLSALKDRDLVFRVSASDARQAQVLASVALDAGHRSVAVAHGDDAYNSDLARLFAKAFRARGGKVALMRAHPGGLDSYADEVAALAASGADTLMLIAYFNASGIDLLNAAFKADAFQYVIGSDGMANAEVARRVDPDKLDRLAVLAPAVDEQTAAFAAFAAMAADFGMNPKTPFAAQAYDAAFLLALAAEQAGSADPAAIAAGLRKIAGPPGEPILPGEWAKAKAAIAGGEAIDYQGASGPISFDAAGDVTGVFALWRRDADGRWRATIQR